MGDRSIKGLLTDPRVIVVFIVTALQTSIAVQSADWKCTPEQAHRNVQLFQQHYQSHTRWTACPSHQWLVRYAQLSTTGPEIVFDVGCNKGYESMNFFAIFAPQAGTSPPAAYQIHQNSSYGAN